MIVFGTQPLGVLHGVVPEVMQRDKILGEFLQSRGLELRFLPFYNGPDINSFIRQGKIDMAMAGDFPVMNEAATGDIRIGAICKRDKASVVTTTQFSSLRDLIGRRIAYPEGTSSHLGLLVTLEATGLKESDVKMVPMSIEKVTSALVTGDIDAFAGWEPIPSAAIAANKNFQIISQFLNSDYVYWTRAFGDRRPEVVRHLLAAYVRALRWLSESESNLTLGATWSIAGTTAFLGKISALDPAQFKHRIRENLALVGTAVIPQDEFAEGSYLRRAFKLLQEKNLLPSGAKWSKVQNSLDLSPFKDVYGNSQEYKLSSFEYRLN